MKKETGVESKLQIIVIIFNGVDECNFSFNMYLFVISKRWPFSYYYNECGNKQKKTCITVVPSEHSKRNDENKRMSLKV